MLLLAEDLLIAAPGNRRDGWSRNQAGPPYWLGSGILLDLVLADRVRAGRAPNAGRAEAVAISHEPGLDPLLDQLLPLVPGQPVKLLDAAARLGRGLLEPLLARLQHQHLVVREPRRWTVADSPYRGELADRIETVLRIGPAEDLRTATLVALLAAGNALPKELDVPGLHRREVRRRALVLTRGEWGRPEHGAAVQGVCQTLLGGSWAGVPLPDY